LEADVKIDNLGIQETKEVDFMQRPERISRPEPVEDIEYAVKILDKRLGYQESR